ncbi:MAG: HAMP domain-containing protein, partial [Pseudomonadota bacterium]
MKRQFRRLAALPITLQIGLAVASALLTLLIANGVAWLSMWMVASTQAQLINVQIPQQASALQLIGQVSNLVAVMPALAESGDQQTLAERFNEYTSLERDLTVTLGLMQQAAQDHAFQSELRERVEQQVVHLVAQGNKLHQLNAQHLAVGDHLRTVLARIENVEMKLMQRLTVELDGQVFFLATGYREIDKAPVPPAQRDISKTVTDLSKLADMRGALLQVTGTLAAMTRVTDISHLQPLVEKIEAGLAHFVVGLKALNSTANRNSLTVGADELSKLSIGSQGVVALVYRQLNQRQEMAARLTAVRTIAGSLRADTEQLVRTASTRATASMDRAESTIRTGYWWIVGLAAVSVIVAGLYVWGYVQPVLTGRLVELAGRMRNMARNQQLHESVKVYGNDEIAQMAQDLEIFRQHTLDAQRLDVVEKLAGELENKNAALEDTLAQLNQAQEQIVLREKLAALGELTAGVAHEIKNPLNFVNNFSATSEELCEELRDLLQNPQVEDPEWLAELGEVVEMLSENMRRINGHGHRADRIVNSMLSLGRHAEADALEVDLAPLVKEHGALAWHSVRATMSGFDVPIEYAFPDTPMLAWVQAQDISRVILNLVTNACHACLDRQASAEPAYAPEITVRGSVENSRVRIDVVDNGVGMSAEVQQ